MPPYSTDREKEGIPEKAHAFKAALNRADGIIISFAEHNGAYTTAFKNVFDWISRLENPFGAASPCCCSQPLRVFVEPRLFWSLHICVCLETTLLFRFFSLPL